MTGRRFLAFPVFCPRCSYDLTGTANIACPECGTPIPSIRLKAAKALTTVVLWIVVVSPVLYIGMSPTVDPVPDDEIRNGRILFAFAVGAAILLLLDWNRARRKRRLDRLIAANICTKCGYNLTANTSRVCPECGTPVSRKVKGIV
jgi:predicted amidophosphoribosyltransferase